MKAALSLRESYMLKPPSSKLSGKDRAAVVAKELGDFLGHYKKETEMFTVFKEESGMIPRLVQYPLDRAQKYLIMMYFVKFIYRPTR